MKRLVGSCMALGLALSLATPSEAQLAVTRAPEAQAAASAALWRQLFERDIDYLEQLVPTRYIYAVHPGGPAWNDLFRRAFAQARREAPQVRDFGSYRGALEHFVAAFEDAHFSAYFNIASRQLRWPRFSLGYRGGRYFVTQSSLPAIGVGMEVTTCDGRPLHEWMDRLAGLLGGPPGRETTRSAIARRFLINSGNPLYEPPRRCQIGADTVDLSWVPVPDIGPFAFREPERTSSSAPTVADSSIGASDFGDNGAWVRIGTMMAMTEDTANQYRTLIERASSLRDKEFVVIDVRGNGGGMYNWFMAFLRAFYGQDYADHHARARLEIANTMLVVSPTGSDDPGFSAEANRIQVPPDPPMASAMTPAETRPLPNGMRLAFARPPVESISYPRRAPPNPVRARVYLLTDYGCGSACLSFVDEMMRFPGVTQIGAETHIDRRSGGWPEGFELPSGLATMRMGRMVREGRRRGENEAWIPTIRFDGDIADTEAVKGWILTEVVPRGRSQASR